MAKWKWIVPAAVITLLVLWLAIRWFGPDSVLVTRPQRGPAVQAVYATGSVEATVMLPIAPRITARLVELHADEGQQSKQDQLLARLEDDDLLQTIRELEAREKYARREYERDAVLIKRKAIPESRFDNARMQWDASKAALARAKAEQGFLQLVAPADGRIIRRDGEVGELIPANQPIFWFSCCAPLRISAEVDEEDIPLVEPGQKVLISADAFPGEVYHGQVQSITPKGDPVARSYRVRISFDNNAPLQIGMTAETNIIIRESQDALLVPTSAVTQQSLWLVEDGRLKQQSVTVGAKGPEQTEIIKGVTEESSVAVNPGADWVEGQRVSSQRMEGK